jgi:glycosyltransferase involved in cell wall biosynthesis
MISMSIVVPTLNSYGLLPRLVGSLQEQTFGCWNVLFVDGESSAEHKDWLEQQKRLDPRFQWINQSKGRKGIYDAMNHGLQFLDDTNCWVLFWGSDDMAATPDVFEKLIGQILEDIDSGIEADLYVCMGRYFDVHKKRIEATEFTEHKRLSRFRLMGSFRRSLFLGSTPPHQATIFGPKIRKILGAYCNDFSIASDLDGFLRLSECPNIKVRLLEVELVLMGDSGVSAIQGKKRLKEVRIAYKRAFGNLWFIPFILRYLHRAISLLGTR